MRTTIDLDPVVLAELKRRQAVEHKTLGGLVSELLAAALADAPQAAPITSMWPTGALRARVDIDDRDAVWAVLDSS